MRFSIHDKEACDGMNRVAVTGLGAITPIGLSASDTWQAMKDGVNGIDRITRFDLTDYKATLAAEVKGFDPAEFGLAKPQARKMDLFTQYAVAAADMAVKDSKIEGTLDPERFGVYIGSGIGGISTLMCEHGKLLNEGVKRISPFFVPMMIVNMATGMIAMRHHAEGPSLPVVTACATSTNAIGEAYRAIKHGYADAVIAGGSEAAINELAIGGFISCMALSFSEDKDRASLPFDAERGGFVMGEGSAVLVLENYDCAVKRGAKIYAEVVGYGNTNDAYHMTAPNPEAKSSAKAIELAVKEAGITDPAKVYVNAHGTGTALNDKTETAALKRVFGDGAYKLKVSSTKSMTGHMLGAAGAVEALASVMALHDGVIPPTINYRVKDADCDLDITPNKAAKEQKEFALSSSLGFGGHNACLAFRRV